MEEASPWTRDLSITVSDRELPGAASRTDVGLPTSLSWAWDQDTEDGTALLLQALLTCC